MISQEHYRLALVIVCAFGGAGLAFEALNLYLIVKYVTAHVRRPSAVYFVPAGFYVMAMLAAYPLTGTGKFAPALIGLTLVSVLIGILGPKRQA